MSVTSKRHNDPAGWKIVTNTGVTIDKGFPSYAAAMKEIRMVPAWMRGILPLQAVRQ